MIINLLEDNTLVCRFRILFICVTQWTITLIFRPFSPSFTAIDCQNYFVENYADSLPAWRSFTDAQVVDSLVKIGVDNFFKKKRFLRNLIKVMHNSDILPVSAYHIDSLSSIAPFLQSCG